MRRIRASFNATMKSLGWVNGLLYLLTRGLDRISGGRVRIVKYDLAVQPLGEGFPLPYRRSGTMELRELHEGDPLLERIEHPAEVIAARFRQGGRCLAAVREDELAGFLWWVEGPYEEDEVRCRFVPSPAEASVWDFDVYVAPAYRGGMVFARLWGAANHDLAARGFRQSCSRISAFKPESLAAHGRLGARVVDKALFFCVGRAQLMFATRYPWVHLSLGSASRPVLRVGS
jgi:GNAT superfamily N-acetyltransferase